MIVMPSNNSGIQIGYLAGKYPGRIGWLISPSGWRRPPSWMPVALDNGAYGAWLAGKPFNEGAFWDLLETAAKYVTPTWVVVPDVVADREKTLESWETWFPIIKEFRPTWKLAFAVQDGMTSADVPGNADVVFVGGTTEWKWKTVHLWTAMFPRVHVARVNTERRLYHCFEHGAESCDGTGWMMGGEERLDELARFLEMTTSNKPSPQLLLV